MDSDKVLQIIHDALKFYYFEKGRFNSQIDDLEMNGGALIIKTLESSEDIKTQDDVLKTQTWRIGRHVIVPVVQRAEGDIALPTVEPVSKADISSKTAKFWQSLFDTAVNDRESTSAGSGKYIGKISLIKAFRALTGDGLAESKYAIDAACAANIFISLKDANQIYEHWVIGTLPTKNAVKKKRR